MAEGKVGSLFKTKLFLSGLGWAFRETVRERSLTPQLSTLHTADELMKVVRELTSEHGGSGAAFKYAKRALELEPSHARANEFMANYYLTSGEFSQALPYTERLTQLKPESVSAHVTQGEVWRGLGRLQDALGEYEAALALSPTSPGLWIIQAEILSALGRHAEAADAYARRLALGDGSVGAVAYARDPETAVAYGRELHLAGHTDDALEVWQTVANMENVYPPTKKEIELLLASVKKE